jgi:GNAT superfamily N-acetyltransferase
MSTPAPALETVTGAANAPLLPALSRLRIAVFREWPYLYDGAAASEEQYLRSFLAGADAAIVVARDAAGTPVGCATCIPALQSDAAVQAALRRGGIDPARTCYFGESVLLPAHRGGGIGVGFFTAREAQARRLGLTTAAFCAVVRNPNDPRRPSAYTPLDGFWAKRGFRPRRDVSLVIDWREIGDDRETPHSLAFWVKDPL